MDGAAVEARRCVENAVESILALDGSADAFTGDAGRAAFKSLEKATSRAKAWSREVLAEIDEKNRVLEFVVEFASRKAMYKRQAASVLAVLLAVPEWEESVGGDVDLLRRLREVGGDRVAALLNQASEAEPEAAAASSGNMGAEADRSPAAAAFSTPTSTSGNREVDAPTFEVPYASAAAASPAPYPASESNHIPAPPTVPEPLPATAGYPQFERRLSGDSDVQESGGRSHAGEAPLAGASNSRAAALETRRMLREGFESLEALNYEADGGRRGSDAAFDAFNKLYQALNRAHYEASGKKRAYLAQADECSNASGVPGVADVEGPELDVVVEALEGCPCDPRRTLLFLSQLTKVKKLHKRRIEAAATQLTQVSALFREATRSDDDFAAWLGTNEKDEGKPAHTVSYGFASTLRWMTWDAGWYWVNTRRGDTRAAEKDAKYWKVNERALMESVEFREPVLEKLLQAVNAAARHCALQRWPEERKGLISWVANGILGGEDKGPYKDEFFAVFDELDAMGAFETDLAADLRWLIWNMAWYPANKAKGERKNARGVLRRAERHFHRAFRGEGQWRGVNLGGWFLLEPGPCERFWASLPPEARATSCEWGCCAALGPDRAQKLLSEHRRTYFNKDDFAQMREAGFSHVRLPFGAWCVVGPRRGEPYVGPCLEALDSALEQLESAGMRVILDLHGGVGGENSEAPCGRIHGDWRPQCWDRRSSLRVLQIVAERYAGRVCICGFSVANEPAENISAKDLTSYYEAAVRTIRQAGMRAGEVAVLLPIFTERRIGEILDIWEERYPHYEDCVFDLHFYQCFGSAWGMVSRDRHLQLASDRVQCLDQLPTCCVSEWSLALPSGATKGLSEEDCGDLYRRFGQKQVEAYEHATHGWFFWTWRDSAGVVWNCRDALARGLLQVPDGGRATTLIDP